MPDVKKQERVTFSVIPKQEFKEAWGIEAADRSANSGSKRGSAFESRERTVRVREFLSKYGHPYKETLVETERWHHCLSRDRVADTDELYARYLECLERIRTEPMKTMTYGPWGFAEGPRVFNGFAYSVKGVHSDDEIRLLIMEDFDRERRHFEKLKAKFDRTSEASNAPTRERIPENVRIEVWRRDGGKCAKCGSRERLEYDHIVPVSQGGDNTARNVELLCEEHNTRKSNNTA